ncbi:cytidine deaminase-like protein [Entophlyctis helioformis]|nr:cytidine deaminase-like protein [Entophlyctis helioformis]
MLVGLVGPTCAGKSSTMHLLQDVYGFVQLLVSPALASALPATDDNDGNDGNDDIDGRPILAFPTATALCEHATIHWRRHFVVKDINALDDWQQLFLKRPFVLLVAVDAPVGERYRRWRARQQAASTRSETNDKLDGKMNGLIDATDMASFVTADDAAMYGPSTHSSALYSAMQQSHLTLLNATSRASDLHALVSESAAILHVGRLRPDWDTYFMQLCDLAAMRSNCMKRRVGCILVNEKRVIATGYNGTPRGVLNCNEGGCARCNGGAARGSLLDTCLCLHAEENALLEAGRERISSSGHSILYCNTCPCLGCAKKIIQSGVKEVVYAEGYGMDDMTASLLHAGGVKLRQHSVLPRLYSSLSGPAAFVPSAAVSD